MAEGKPYARPVSRRWLLKSGLATGTALFLCQQAALGRTFLGGDGVPWSPNVADTPYFGTEPYRFFTESERQAVEALTSRIIPTDETGPGAREAEVTTFIDRQLGGYYGSAHRWYMRGPFPEALETQGYQAPYTPAGLWRAGLSALDEHCRETYDGRPFVELSEEEQDAVLTAIEEEEVEFEGVSGKQFFAFAKEMTIEGFFCDPIYGGNRDMVGWRYVGFPGARYDYRDFLNHDGAPLDIAPVGLLGRPAWSR